MGGCGINGMGISQHGCQGDGSPDNLGYQENRPLDNPISEELAFMSDSQKLFEVLIDRVTGSPSQQMQSD